MAEFLVEEQCPVALIERIGVYSSEYQNKVFHMLQNANIKPALEVIKNWYY